MSGPFVEVGSYQLPKWGQEAPGDVFMSRKSNEANRVISVLSDGLGSGIKAGVLATLTATLASGCIASNLSVRRTAGIVMASLPVCSERKIAYSTFSIVDVAQGSQVSVVEYDNPPYFLLRDGAVVEPERSEIRLTKRGVPRGHPKTPVLGWSSFPVRTGDRLILCSDGVTQAGMGTGHHPLGWGMAELQKYAAELLRDDPGMSARDLARAIALRAAYFDGGRPKDDITCSAVYFRKARRLLLLSGPPMHPEDDPELASIFDSFEGRKIICGGTTATIVSRELGRKVSVSLRATDPSVPPAASMEGAELITEGIVTLGRVCEYLEQDAGPEALPDNAASQVLRLLLDSDEIQFVVGTKINEAHQDPAMPVELEIRRNVIRRLKTLLEEKQLKETKVRFI